MGIRRKKYATLACRAGVFFAFCWTIFPFLPENPSSALPLLASYTTYFDADNLPRSHNIALAAKKISGLVLCQGERFSFNATVGKRTAETGFSKAPVILSGEFVSDYGGGVCQVSTTLYNAMLLAGLSVCEVHGHSLQVSYVPPSRDAMVSDFCDLQAYNPRRSPVALRLTVGKGSITAEVYGRETGLEYRLESVSLAVLSPPPVQVVEGEEDAVVRPARTGLKSEGYLCVFRRGKMLSRTRIRRDGYAAVGEIRQEKKRE